jgi:hypothetical protein
MGKGSNRGEMIIEGMDTELMPQDMEGMQEDGRLSPKRINKMKVEKNGELKNERHHNSTQRTAYKAGKT